MPDTSYEFLIKFFVNHLPFTPTAGQIDDFSKDLSLISPYLMEASLIEVKLGSLGKRIAEGREWRPAIFAVYNRKIAEHELLFPIFHSFETAFRSTVSVTLERHYQEAKWWRGIYDTLRTGHPARSVTHIGKIKIPKDTAHAIGEIIYAIDGNSFEHHVVGGFGNGYQFTECCDLSHISRLITAHWALFAPRFVRGGNRLSVTHFNTKFGIVREARNDVYHHKSVARMKDVVANAEDLLDYLDFSLAFVFEKIMNTNPQEPKFVTKIEKRHRTW
jgi:hypothetical protein